MKYDFFISYCREDAEFVGALAKRLRAAGISIWFDQHIDGGADWREAIVEALEDARALLIVFSSSSNGSSQLIKEIAIADDLDLPVIPVLIDKVRPRGGYLYELATRNWITLYPAALNRVDELVEKLKDLVVDVRSDGKAAKLDDYTATQTRKHAPFLAIRPLWDMILYGVFIGWYLYADPVGPLNAILNGLTMAVPLHLLVMAFRHAAANHSLMQGLASYLAVPAGIIGIIVLVNLFVWNNSLAEVFRPEVTLFLSQLMGIAFVIALVFHYLARGMLMIFAFRKRTR